VSVVTNTQGTAINAAEGTLLYPSDILEPISVSKTGSIFTLWIQEPQQTDDAHVAFNGGVPSPGYTGTSGKIFSVTFRARRSGTATLSLSDTAVYANDGLGTNVFSGNQGSSITITAPAYTNTPASSDTNTAPHTPVVPVIVHSDTVQITSSSHPDQNIWYASSTPLLLWTLPSGVDALRADIVSQNDAKPTTTVSITKTQKLYGPLADGVWYFNVRARAQGSWGDTQSYALHIDTTPPLVSSSTIAYDEARNVITVSVKGVDGGSGIAGYRVAIDDDTATYMNSSQIEEQTYERPIHEPGVHTIVVNVFDKAGNTTSFTTFVRVPTPASAIEHVLAQFGISSDILFVVLLALVVIILFLLVVIGFSAYGRLHMRRLLMQSDVQQLTHHTHDVMATSRDQLHKTVRALEQAGLRPGITPEEAKMLAALIKHTKEAAEFADKKARAVRK
jgi:hypothetical protein